MSTVIKNYIYNINYNINSNFYNKNNIILILIIILNLHDPSLNGSAYNVTPKSFGFGCNTNLKSYEYRYGCKVVS
jgi:hypothetical protein